MSAPFDRITVNPNQMAGVPCIRGMRIPLTTVLDQLAGGATVDELLTMYPDLERADLTVAVQFAAALISFTSDEDIQELLSILRHADDS